MKNKGHKNFNERCDLTKKYTQECIHRKENMESAISLSLSSTSLSFQFFIGLVVINMGKYQPFDLITLLLYYDLIELCFKIFNHLEAKSLTNCRLVSSHWRNFIDYQFNEMPKGRFIGSTNISNAYFSVEILTISL